MRQSEFKKKYNSETGKFTRQHIFNRGVIITGEGIADKFKSLIKRKKTQKTPPPPPKTWASSSKKAGDQIVKMLQAQDKTPPPAKQTREKINNKVLQIMSGGKIM